MGDASWFGGQPFHGKRIDMKGNVLGKGDLIVASHELQFILAKSSKKLQRPKEEYPFSRIKSYGYHENVLSLQLGGEDKLEVVHFKLKEAIVVKEIMDQVIKMKRKPNPRMPSFDSQAGFYDMRQVQSPGKMGSPLQRKLSLQDNINYSTARPKMLQRSVSTDSSGSSVSSGPPSAGLNPGYDNPLFTSESNVQYALVETVDDDPFSPASPSKKMFSPSGKGKPAIKAKFGYSQMDIPIMETLRENELKKSNETASKTKKDK